MNGETNPSDQLKRLLQAIEAETMPMSGHQDPGAIKDCWRLAEELIENMLDDASYLAANQCLYGLRLGDGGHAYCHKVSLLEKQNAALKAVIRELINIAEILCIATELYSFRMPGVIQKMPKYKVSIDKARKLLTQQQCTNSSQSS